MACLTIPESVAFGLMTVIMAIPTGGLGSSILVYWAHFSS